jgi:hypothetical protein
MRKITTILAAIALSGCASSHVQLQVNTQPAGAYITEANGTVLGTAPVLTQYPRESLKKHNDGRGCSVVKGFNAQWVSGATATTGPTVRLCGKDDLFNITITRNTSEPGLDKDLEFALRLSTAGAAQRQAGATEDAAMFQFLNLVKPGR